MARGRHIVESSDEEDEFPDIATVAIKTKKTAKADDTLPGNEPSQQEQHTGSVKAPMVRRRKLGQITNNILLRPAEDDVDRQQAVVDWEAPEKGKYTGTRRQIPLRTRKTKPSESVRQISSEDEDEDEDGEDEGDSLRDFIVSDSDFEESSACDDDEDSFDDLFVGRSPSKRRLVRGDRLDSPSKATDLRADLDRASPEPREMKASDFTDRSGRTAPNSRRKQSQTTDTSGLNKEQTRSHASSKALADKDLSRQLSRLNINGLKPAGEKTRGKKARTDEDGPHTPPSTPPKPPRTELRSPQKLTRIPMTPHGPHVDMFWSQEFVDDWNDEHSPKKVLFPTVQKSPAETGAAASPQKSPAKAMAEQRQAKKAFEKARHEIAKKFLRELDEVITGGKLAELAASTGGIKIVWTNKLYTTAGRASWKRETVRTPAARKDATREAATAAEATIQHRHHAFIELAEKVIDDEHRLLNVVAHEFCHLANFMVSGVTGNPHGREFKDWAGRVSAAFGTSRGVEVTTKHIYEIAFRYAWACASCGAEYKRHSRSIDPARHRCGSCKGELRQTKPAPRVTTAPRAPAAPDIPAAAGAKTQQASQKQPSVYQQFMKEQMKVIRLEQPGVTQRDLMKLVAERWATSPLKAKKGPERPTKSEKGKKPGDSNSDSGSGSNVDDVANGLVGLTLEDNK